MSALPRLFVLMLLPLAAASWQTLDQRNDTLPPMNALKHMVQETLEITQPPAKAPARNATNTVKTIDPDSEETCLVCVDTDAEGTCVSWTYSHAPDRDMDNLCDLT